jgi:hypothetical protein
VSRSVGLRDGWLQCKAGMGVDRHLYAMYCLAREQGFVPDIFTVRVSVSVSLSLCRCR